MFGTHCIVNSFAAPFLFFGLALCLPSQENTKFHSSRTTGRKRYSNMNGEISRSSHVLQKDPPTSAMNGSLRMTNNFVPAPTTHDYVYSEHSVADIKNKNSKNCNHQNESHSMCNNESYINRTNTSKENCQRKAGINRNHIRHSFGGFLIGTLCYIRPDTALYFGIVYTSILCAYVRLFRYSYLQNNRHDLFLTVVGTTLGPCFGVLYDCWRYRSLVISPLNWIKFNLITNKSSALFGSKNYTEYTNIIFYSRYDELLFVIAVLFYLYKSLFGKHDSLTFKLSLPIQISFIFLLICYFSISHKEARFLNNFIVLYFIIISYGLHILIEIASQICPKKSNILTGIILFLLSFCLNTYYNFPSAADALIKKLAYKNAITSKNVNVCLDFISKANDVSGVMIDASIFESNAFSILQNNVPLLTKIHNEYRLYKADSAGKFLSRKGIRVLSSYVDFIDAQNPQYLLRLLGMSNTFNYIVTNRVNFYKVMKYDEIFKSGSYSVLLRNLSVTQEETLNRIAEALPLGMNATILEYETNWLLTAGLYEVAIGRAKRSLELDQSRVRVFQQLMVAYAKINEWGEVEKYQNLCFSVHGQIACEKQQDKIVLYNEYRQFDNSWHTVIRICLPVGTTCDLSNTILYEGRSRNTRRSIAEFYKNQVTSFYVIHLFRVILERHS